MKPNMVAMLGWIIPAPLLIPVTLMVLPAIVVCVLAALGTVSVVMMPSAASNHCCEEGVLPAAAIAAGRPATMRVWGRGSMITPVENGKTCWGLMLSAWAKAAQVSLARCKPSSPVPALALPVFMSNARMPWLVPSGLSSGLAWIADKCWRQICTGAAQNLFCVNTPPTDAPSSINTTVKSLRPAFLIPAWATPMRRPGTGWSWSAVGGAR